MNYSPRLNQILLILLNLDTPISSEQIATDIKTSKRTVFRELENSSKHLEEIGLQLISEPGKGIMLIGSKQSKKILLSNILEQGYYDPKNSIHRRNRLFIVLFNSSDPIKIYALAKILDISENTVKRELDFIQNWFEETSIKLVRKPGLGLYLEGSEQNYRKALMRFIHQNLDNDYSILHEFISISTVDTIETMILNLHNHKIKAMTNTSFKSLVIFISIIIFRVSNDKKLIVDNITFDKTNSNYQLTLDLCNQLESHFPINLSIHEQYNLYIYLKGVKTQTSNAVNLNYGDFDLLCLVYDMIDAFDSSISYQLKNDDDLIRGLVAHLIPTIERLKNHIEIHNAFLSDITTQYPDTYRMAKNAAKVLQEKIGCEIPEEELGLLTLHFGAGCIRHQNRIKSKIKVGVVCASGIGVSALLSSRLKSIFNSKITVNCFSLDQLDIVTFSQIDLLISTFDLPSIYKSYIKVHPMILDEDITKINEKINSLQPKLYELNTSNTKFIHEVDNISLANEEVLSILKNYDVYLVDSDITFEALCLSVGMFITKNDPSAQVVKNDLLRRESLSSQVIPEYNIVLLHAKTDAVTNSKFIVIKPSSNNFIDPYFHNAKSVIVMLIPKDLDNQVMAIARISSAIFDNKGFLNSIIDGNKDMINKYIENTLRQYLKERFENI